MLPVNISARNASTIIPLAELLFSQKMVSVELIDLEIFQLS